MTTLKHKIDFKLYVAVKDANPNGDPLNGNRPRTTYDGIGEMSAECIKRKIRNRLQDMGQEIFVQSEDRASDEHKSLHKRAIKFLGKDEKTMKEDTAKKLCDKWIDVRSFGQVFVFKRNPIGVRGPVSVHIGKSVSPVDVHSMKITKSVNWETSDTKGRDTMGDRHFVDFGLYEIKGSINVQLAEKTGFSQEDALLIKECLRTLFINDASSARPDGSMEVVTLYWWNHNCKDGQYSSAKVHRSVEAKLREGVSIPSSINDYEISITELDGLTPEVVEGM